MTLLRQTSSTAPAERARPRTWAQMAGSTELAAWVETAAFILAADDAPSACVLGPATFAGATVVPIVVFDKTALAKRASSGTLPALDRMTLSERLQAGGETAASPVLDAMFVGIWGRTSLTSLARLGGYGRTALIVLPGQAPGSLKLAECDWRGIGVCAVADSDARQPVTWLVQPEREKRSGTTTIRFEQLVDLAALGVSTADLSSRK